VYLQYRLQETASWPQFWGGGGVFTTLLRLERGRARAADPGGRRRREPHRSHGPRTRPMARGRRRDRQRAGAAASVGWGEAFPCTAIDSISRQKTDRPALRSSPVEDARLIVAW